MNPLWSNIFRKKPEEESLAFFLGTIPLFAEMTPRELHYLETLVHIRPYDAGENVFSEGDPGSGLYMIRSGRVRIFCHDPRGKDEDLALAGPGDFFGEATLATPAVRTASARTLEKSELIGLFRADLLEMRQKSPQIANKVLVGLTRLLSERLHAAGTEIRRLQRQVLEAAAAEAAAPQG
jgi:CRP/FNR family transcriptional regulator, cyclic AMP receptor protein